MSTLDEFDDLVTKLKTLSFDYAGDELSLAQRVVTRLADVQPPCILAAVATIDHPTMNADFDELTVRLYLVSGDIDEHRALRSLLPLLAAIRSAGVSPTEPTQVVELQIPGQQRGLPALQFTTQLI